MVPKCEPLCQFSSRLYFTTFPDPAPKPAVLNRLAAEPGNRPRVRVRSGLGNSSTADENASYYYFTIDDHLLYQSFFRDWGPLNIGMVYKACLLIHELLQDEDLAPLRLVLYSSNDPQKKANAALLMALYVMIVQRRAPWDAFHPIAELEFMPFRDAGKGPSDFNLNIQDCLWGMWKAIQNNLCELNEFDVDEYEYYEKVENGDWNWITPNFIAFASPVDTVWVKEQRRAAENNSTPTPHSSSPTALQKKLPTPFLNCLDYFEKRNIKVVVRLNTELYDRNTFIERGIDHLELYFDDGTNPTDEIVRMFIDVADKVIEGGGVVAVHCKAGLGRTGTLIGAYLIWKYGFTANEVIAFMRIVRPGSVVGPQQQYMYCKQLEWCKWSAFDEMRRKRTEEANTTPALVTPATPPAETDDEALSTDTRMKTPPPSGVAMNVSLPPVTPHKHVGTATDKAKSIAPPGQPRKTPTAKRVAPASDEDDSEAEDVLPAMLIPPRSKPTTKTSRVTATRNAPASERAVRVTRTTTAANARRPINRVPNDPPMKSTREQRPNKIPRLATTRSTTSSKASATLASGSGSSSESLAPPLPTKRVPPPTPSRLPTLVYGSKKSKPHHAPSLSELASPAGSKDMSTTPDDWMSRNVSAVVVPADKSTGLRPGLRNIRRRRSSFSAADVIA